MPIIVDKDKKRRDIAFSVKELILEKGIKKLTITEIVKKAGISRGSVYDYFESKEEIVFEIVIADLLNFQKSLLEKSTKTQTSRQKTFSLFDFVLSDEKKVCQEREVYKEYLTVSLTSKCEKMAKFNQEFTILLKNILSTIMQEGIDKGELQEEALIFVDALLAAEKGFLLRLWTENNDIKNEFTQFINTVFDLVQKDK